MRQQSNSKTDALGRQIIADYNKKAISYVTPSKMRNWLCRGSFFYVYEEGENITVYAGPCKKRPQVQIGTFSLKDNYVSHLDDNGILLFRKLIGFFQWLTKKSVFKDNPHSTILHGSANLLRMFDGFTYTATEVV